MSAEPARRNPIARALHQLRSPYYRYRNARYLHAVRVAVAMLFSIALTSGLGIPHGFWASVTLLVVIGGLQHHGNIRKKAAERGLATAIGAALGLLLIAQHTLIGSVAFTYVLVSLLAGVCAYFAVGKAGYIALLTAITLSIVAGHGDNPIDIGLWRAFNVAIGTVIALVFSFAFPLYATYDWRFRLAENLRECARLYPRVMMGEPMTAQEQVYNFARLSGRLVKLRSLIAPAAKELNVAPAQLEEIQRLHRSIISALEMLAVAAAHRPAAVEWGATGDVLAAPRSTIRRRLLAMSRALRSGDMRRLQKMDRRIVEPAGGPTPDRTLHYELQGSYWLAQRLSEQVEQMSTLITGLHLK
ncbi:FUSC family protein [Salinisphaera aquimarina]|uniref:FUSC family protein n=1 Tax=Salinisphaera aquimarina TaxID=2094031 RepID=A0ABV7ERB4_9GAMM